MQPDNYFLMTNLCGLLIQDNKKGEARKYYEKYLVKNGLQLGSKALRCVLTEKAVNP